MNYSTVRVITHKLHFDFRARHLRHAREMRLIGFESLRIGLRARPGYWSASRLLKLDPGIIAIFLFAHESGEVRLPRLPDTGKLEKSGEVG